MENSNQTTSTTTMNNKADNAAALSWWRESHNRPHHSQWLQATLSDLDEKTQPMLEIIQQDGDTFAKRAEMFYAKKPELIERLENFYKSYRSMAENYDQLRSDLVQAKSLSSLDTIKLQIIKKCEKEITSHYLKHKSLPNSSALDTKTTCSSESDEYIPRKCDDIDNGLDSTSDSDKVAEGLRDLENLEVKLLEGRIAKLEDEKVKLVRESGHKNQTIMMLREENSKLKGEVKKKKVEMEAELKEKELMRARVMNYMTSFTGSMTVNEVEKPNKTMKKKKSFISRLISGCIRCGSSDSRNI